MKALLTGATGFIGSTLAHALVSRGYSVTCLLRKKSDLRWIQELEIDHLRAALDRPEEFGDALPDFSFVFHCAGLTKSHQEDAYYATNARDTALFAKAVADRCRNLKRFVLLSSLSAAGPSLDSRPIAEDAEPHPVSVYGRSKLQGEQAVLSLRERMPVTVIRPPGVYGPKDRDFFFIFQAVRRGIVPTWGPTRYSLLYVDDLVEGMIAAAEHPAAEGEVFFFADPAIYTGDDIIGEIGRALKRRPLKLRLPRTAMPLIAAVAQKIDKKGIMNVDRVRDFRYREWICSPAKAEALLGYRSRTTLREGVTWTADWYRNHRWL